MHVMLAAQAAAASALHCIMETVQPAPVHASTRRQLKQCKEHAALLTTRQLTKYFHKSHVMMLHALSREIILHPV